MKHVDVFWSGADRQPVRSAAPVSLIDRPFHLWLAAAFLLLLVVPAHAQVSEAGNAGGLSISAGVMGSGFYLGYGERKMLGYSAFVDADTRRRIGVEAEGRWLRFHKTDDVDASTYLIGGRYHLDIGSRFQVYAKGLIGDGVFNFPYGYAHGSYLVIAPGAGVDYHLYHRLYWRAEAEYQDWPGFTFGAMSSYGVSTGLRVRVF